MSFETWILAHGEDLQFAMFFAFLPLLAIVERIVPRRDARPGRKARWRANLILTALAFLTLGLVPVSLVAAAAWVRAHGFGLLNVVPVPVAAASAVTLLARAFLSFGTHYLMHKVPVLWRLHRVHHLDPEMDVSTTVRFHPLELIVTVPPALVLVAALGLTPWVLAVYELLDVAVNLLSHANVSLPEKLERWLRYVIVTPDLHLVHHSSLQPETDSNFGAVFPVWDLALGTFRTASTPPAAIQLGLEVRDERVTSVGWLLASIARHELEPNAPSQVRAAA